MSNIGSKPIIAKDPQGRVVRYQTQGEPLGAGSGGTVYLALRMPDTEEAGADDARRVAIKLTHNPEWKVHLRREARLLHDLQQHASEILNRSKCSVFRPIRITSGPNPLTVDDSYGSELIELEYLDGPTLKTWFDETWSKPHTRTPTEIVDELLVVARQLGEALSQIHEGTEQALIHRDVKPDNIMRTSRGVRLFDFNVSTKARDWTMTQHVGSPGYIAPEVLMSGDYGPSADLYSVGVILWEIAHLRRFDYAMHTIRMDGYLNLRWPTTGVANWPQDERIVLDALLPSLICDPELRLASAEALLRKVDELEAPRIAERMAADPLAKLDMIRLLWELRPSGLVSVVTDTSGRVPEQGLQDFLRDRMQVEDPLEDWLHHELVEAATRDSDKPVLFMLAGNAGDGKSHLMFRLLRQRLADRPEILSRIRAIADATHALDPSASQMDRLAEFFAPFADGEAAPDNRVHLIAMNTGMVIRFFEHEQGAPFRETLYPELQRQLGLRRVEEAEVPFRVEVINLDLRDLLAPAQDGGPSFAERMLDRLDPLSDGGIPGPKWNVCRSCSAFALCPVAFNLQALRSEQPRRALLRVLRRVALDTDIHLSPRNLWGFLYRLVTGGIERYDLPGRGSGDGRCDVVRAQVDSGAGEWLLTGQFTELLFQQPGAGAPWSGLVRHDPAFSSAPAIDHLHTRLGVKTELDNAPKVIEGQLGGKGRVLAGLHLDVLSSLLPDTKKHPSFRGRRRDAAVRRQVLFHGDTFDAWVASDGGSDFEEVLAAYRDFSHGRHDLKALNRKTREQVKELGELVQAVFLHGNGRFVDGTAYLRVSQPNVRAKSELLVKADGSALDELFSVLKIVAPDIHIVAHHRREALLRLLGYRPTQVTLDVLGVRLSVDLELYDFLRRVKEGQKPSVRDLSRFQALLFVGERVGNALAVSQRTKELFVWDGARLHRLATDAFGQPQMQTWR